MKARAPQRGKRDFFRNGLAVEPTNPDERHQTPAAGESLDACCWNRAIGHCEASLLYGKSLSTQARTISSATMCGQCSWCPGYQSEESPHSAPSHVLMASHRADSSRPLCQGETVTARIMANSA